MGEGRRWLGLIALLGCQDPTQITVQLSGRGFVCQPSGAVPSFESAGVIARPQLGTSLGGPRAVASPSDCTGTDPVQLGSVVLVPSDGPGPVEVLIVGELTSADGVTNAPDACVAAYERTLEGGALAAKDFQPELCIYARRSLAFVKHSSLTLPIELSLECAGVVCEPSLTCEPGRGCVSSATNCEEDGSCAVDPGNGGSGGAGGDGAAGGAGGDGGAGGWRSLPVPADATPLDVVGVVDPSTQSRALYVAAGTRMLRYQDDQPSHPQAQGDATSFAAVAARGGSPLGEVIAIGSGGLRYSMDDFVGSDLPAGWPSVAAVRYDVAWRGDQASPFYAVDGGSTCYASLALFGAPDPSAVCGVAVAASASTYAVAAGQSLHYFNVVGTGSIGAEAPSDRWVVATLSSASPYAVYMPSSGESFGVFSIQNGVTSYGGGLFQGGVAPQLASVVVVDVASPKVYGVGTLAGQPWFGRFTVVPGDSTFGWEDLPPPPGIALPKSLWIGPEGVPQPTIAVVGDGGVAVARLADVVPSL